MSPVSASDLLDYAEMEENRKWLSYYYAYIADPYGDAQVLGFKASAASRTTRVIREMLQEYKDALD